MRRRQLLALSLLFNLPFLLFRVHRAAYDTYTHIFLADHYRERWWSLWEPRWYMGFSMASYPPLIHQLIGLLSRPLNAVIVFFSPAPEPYPGAFRWLGEEIAFVLVLLSVLCLFPLSVRALARVFGGPHMADVAGLVAIFAPSLSLTAWAFGQLPTVAATVVVLFALALGADFARTGRPLKLLQAAALAGVAGALHHGVFLFAPFAGLAVVWRVLSVRRRAPELLSLSAGLARLLLWSVLSALLVALALWPFLWWSRSQDLQTPIDHASRHNFLADPLAQAVFFWPMYGPLLLIVAAMPWLIVRWRRFSPLLCMGLVLFVLGLGGTTPLPAWLFGAGWEWLTYDRFSFWASVLLLPAAGGSMLWLKRKRPIWGWRLSLFSLGGLIAWASVSGWLSVLMRAQPAPLEMRPFVIFLNQPEQRGYRYLTLGFGDQFAKLSALTSNGSLDGNYHTARQLPELRTSGLGALDTAMWNSRGTEALAPFLAHAERYGVRWVFANHAAYHPLLAATGWRFRWYEGDVTVWDKPDVLPVSMVEPAGMRDTPAAMWWASAPLIGLTAALGLLALEHRLWRISRPDVIRGLAVLRRMSWAVTVLLLSLWWYHEFRPGAEPFVYFTYQSVLLFASDGMLALTLLLWALERWLRRERVRLGPLWLACGGLALICACALSIAGAQDRALAAALTAHLALLAGAYLCLVNDPLDPAFVGGLFGAVLLALTGLALWQVIWQQTTPLNLPWPGALTAARSGASVVVNAAGARWLRAYGALPHPNILGGVILVYWGAVIERYLRTGNRWWLGAVALAGLTLALSFSRAAWLGALAEGAAILFWLRPPYRARARTSVVAGLAAAAFAVVPLLPFFLARTSLGGAEIPVEQRSIGDRTALIRASFDLWRAHPWLGVGAGNFVAALARLALPDAPLEPVHNLILLVVAETGLPGAFTLAALLGVIAHRLRQRRPGATLTETVWAAVLIGVLVAAMLDHFWWTLSPTRTLFVIAVAFWAGAQGASPEPVSEARAHAGPAS